MPIGGLCRLANDDPKAFYVSYPDEDYDIELEYRVKKCLPNADVRQSFDPVQCSQERDNCYGNMRMLSELHHVYYSSDDEKDYRLTVLPMTVCAGPSSLASRQRRIE